MRVVGTALEGVKIIEPRVHADSRGDFLETYSARRYREQVAIELPFVQDNVSRSGRDVLRGLHLQLRRPQGKLIQVLEGSAYDVVVDLRAGSATFGRHIGVALSETNRRQLWVPPGFAHGFCVTGEVALLHYKCTDYYDPQDESGLAWNCPVLNIDWPVQSPVLSEKDARYPGLKDWLACHKRAVL
ncbi:MAG TPA: dTDP-4-dehydrorhamnose 3,5-epimerase [Castellaniella sp.]|uniref:dTDP-4-dehydrorhamnose 3,5-epimerase n=1 Tax=Castellaniella sp. TaxID=1955812 RepID=UPI002F0E9BD6